MSRKARVLKSGVCEVTQDYKGGSHNGIDIVKKGYQLDYIVAHSDGKVIQAQDGLGNMKGTNSYGNYVKIEHENGYCTLYAHLEKGISIRNGQAVKKGQVLGYMGNSGNSYGGHLHFEVWENGKRINPTKYLEADLPKPVAPSPAPTTRKVGDVVTINGVYVSSTSTNKLTPLKTKGKITKIVAGARNPYLLDNGNIGWVNDACIVSTTAPKKKSTDEIAREVIQGKWGNGAERKSKLEKAGYNYREVQNRVNELLK